MRPHALERGWQVHMYPYTPPYKNSTCALLPFLDAWTATSMPLDVTRETDASSLRVATLRVILQDYGIVVPGHARKSALVAAFNEHVRPKLPSPSKLAGPKPEPSLRMGTPGIRRPSTANACSAANDIRFSDENPFQSSTPCKKRQSHAAPQTTPVSRSPLYTRSTDKVRQMAESSVQPKWRAAQLAPVWQQIQARWQETFVRWALWLCMLVWVWYCWQSRLEGFCSTGAEQPSWERPTNVWQALQKTLTPVCTPCPEHGICVGGRLDSCDASDYKVEEPMQGHIPLLAQLIPFSWRASQCVPDTHKLLLASELADAVVDYLAHFHGQVRCKLALPHGQAPLQEPLGRYALPERQVRDALETRTIESVDAATFDFLWQMVMDGLLEHAPGDMQSYMHQTQRWLVSRRKIMPFTCRLRMYVLDWVWRYRFALLTILVAVIGTCAISRRVQRQRIRRHVVATHAQAVFERLKLQAAQAVSDGTLVRGLPVTHLRDQLLQAELNPHARRQLWHHVAKVVERNANVRTRQAQWHGEWQRIWEWMGPVHLDEPAMSRTAPSSPGQEDVPRTPKP